MPSSILHVPSSLQLTVANHQRAKKIDLRLLKKVIVVILVELKIAEAEIEVNLVGEKKMTQINETFLQHKGSTDVITFDYTVGQASSLSQIKKKKYRDRQDACPTMNGEIFVCVDEAIGQSKKFKTDWQSEIVRYIVHGILHLLGYDDLRAEARRKMKREENRLVRKLAKKISFAQIERQL